MFTETDAKELHDYVLNQVQKETGPLYPGDERRIFTEALIALGVTVFNTIDDCAKQSLLKYAGGEVLDDIADGADCVRLKGEKAKTVLQFDFSNMTSDVTIPKGIRASTLDGKYFITTEEKKVDIGVSSVTVQAESEKEGSEYNDILPDSISVIVDPVSFCTSVKNTTTTSYGKDEETDEELRQRVRDAYSHFATTGTEPAYRYFATTLNSNIIDATVNYIDYFGSLPRGTIDIRVAMKDGSETPESVLQDILEKITDPWIEPLGDNVAVAAAQLKSYSLDITYYVSSENSDLAIEAIESETYTDENGITRIGAIEQYKRWVYSKIGRNTDKSKLISLMMNPAGDGSVPGAVSVKVNSDDVEISNAQVGHLDSLSITRNILKE